MTTATWLPISSAFNPVTDKPRFCHGSVQVHHFPFSKLNFISHIDSSLGCYRECKQQKRKTLVTKDDCILLEKEQVNHGVDMEQLGFVDYVSMLQECVRRKSVREGKQIHAQVIKNQEEANVFLGTSLTNMYAKCGSLVDAHQVFDKMPERNIVSWTAMLTAYIQYGYWEDALNLMGSMYDAGMLPNQITVPRLLSVCGKMRDLTQGKVLHGMAIKTGFVSNVYVDSALVDMYAKCDLLMDARRVFDKILEPNGVSWTAMIISYVRNEYHEEAIILFSQMRWSCTRADDFALASVLTACAYLENLHKGKQVHAYIIKSLTDENVWIGNALITMYSKSGDIEYASKVFETMSKRNLGSWTAMVAGYAQNGCTEKAVELSKEMQFANVHHFPFSKPSFVNRIDSSLGCYRECKQEKLETLVTKDDSILLENEQVNHGIDLKQFGFIDYASILQECVRRKSLREGKQIHAQAIKNQEEADVFLGTSLLNMYAKCGSLVYARQVFDKMPERSIVSWTAMLTAYIQNGYWQDALKLMGSMHDDGMMPDRFTLPCLLRVCAGMRDPTQGKVLHGMAIKTGFVSDVYVDNALVDMYAKCNLLMDARRVFNKILEPNVVSWTAMIRSFVWNEYDEEAINLFSQMQWSGTRADDFALSSVLRACANLEDLQMGKQVHVYIIKSPTDENVWVGNALITMYSKSGDTEYASKVFKRMSKRNVVSWTAMIAGYGQNGCTVEALELYKEMQFANVQPNPFTFDTVLAACICLKYLRFGKQIHAQVWKTGFTSDSFVESTLVNLYAKCGHIEDAHNVFDQGPKNDVVLWTKVIIGYAEYGYDNEALNLLNKIQLSLVNKTYLTFSSILKACAYVRSLKRGKEIHAQAVKSGLELDLFVGTSLIDMYSKCGNTDDAFKMFNEMPTQNIVSWNAMIAGCIRNDHFEQALNFFRKMQIEGIKPDEFTFASILCACASLAAFELGKQVHVCIIKGGYESDGPVQNTIDFMYDRLRVINNPHNMFDKTPVQNVVS